jgi:Flp pilus assembly pilin Flp
MMRVLLDRMKNQRGIETLEWILIGALIVAVGLAIYPGALQPSLQNATSTIGSTVQTQASS